MISIGVIGAGPWGRNHIRVLKESNYARLDCVSDTSDSVLSDIKSKFNVVVCKDYKSLLSNSAIDAVTICLPASLHFSVCKEALESGKHVFVEKPFVLDSKDGQELVELAASKNLKLAVGQIFRFDPTIIKAKEEINKGSLGKIYFLSLARMGLARPREDVGAIFNYAVHDLDIMCDILDQKLPNEITAITTHPLQREFEDFAIITAKFDNNILGYSQVSWLTPKKIRDFWIIGEKKSANVDIMKFELEIFESGIVPKYDSFGTFQLINKGGDSYKPNIEKSEPLGRELSHFIECIEKNQTPINDGLVGLRTVKMAEAALLSAKEKRTVGLDKNGNPV